MIFLFILIIVGLYLYANNILDIRFAKGEITEEEYVRMIQKIKGGKI